MGLTIFTKGIALKVGLRLINAYSRENPMNKPLHLISIVFAYSGAEQAREKIPDLQAPRSKASCGAASSPACVMAQAGFRLQSCQSVLYGLGTYRQYPSGAPFALHPDYQLEKSRA